MTARAARSRRAGPRCAPSPAAYPSAPRRAGRGSGSRPRHKSWSGRGSATAEEGENAPERGPQLPPLHDHVDLAVLEQELRALEPLGKRLPDRLRDDAGAREPDESPGLGQDDVAEHREAGGHAAGSGIGEQRDVGHTLGVEALERGRGLGHLHEREDALLHPGATRRGDDHERDALLQGQLDGAGELLTDHRGHAAAEERELEDGQRDRIAADARGAGDDRFTGVGLAAGGLEAIGVAARVLERQRILRSEGGLALVEGALVGQRCDALARRDAERVPALGTDPAGPIDLGPVDDLLAGVALDPQALGDDDFPGALAVVVLLLPEPRGHGRDYLTREGKKEPPETLSRPP